MASRYIGFNHGANIMDPQAFTQGTSTGSTDIELRVDTGKNWTTGDIMLALKGFEVFLMSQANTALQNAYPATE
jgi:hypothetical protein